MEYAVLMKEMPQERMMNRLLAEGKVREKDIRELVGKLVPFYQQARTGKGINPFGRIEIMIKNTEENFAQTQSYLGRLISARTYSQMVKGTRDFLEKARELFKKRIRENYIRDCHGDLHSANIYLYKKPLIYDCIEFNHRFRYTDVACDLAFLAMDLDFHGRPELSRLLEREYVHRSGDDDLPWLFNFYKGYRAYVRAKVHSFSSENPEISVKEKKVESQLAKKYYQLAYEYIQKGRTPQIVVVFGLMGTGKTSLAKALAAQTGWPMISSDETRKNLQGISPTTRKWEPFGKGIYSEVISRKNYLKMRFEAKRLLEQGQSVILDGSYKRQSERLALMDLAKKTEARIQFLECRAPLKTIRQRLRQRERETRSISDGRWEIFHRQRKDFDPIVDPVKPYCLRIRTTKPLNELIIELVPTLR